MHENEVANGQNSGKRPYVPPAVESETIYETQALGCGMCVRMGFDVGFGDCEEDTSNY